MKIFIALISCFTVFAIAGCGGAGGPSSPSQPQSITLQGTVLDANDNPVRGAQVGYSPTGPSVRQNSSKSSAGIVNRSGSATVSTDADGKFSIPRVPTGMNITLQVAGDSYNTESIDLTPSGSTAPLKVHVYPTGSKLSWIDADYGMDSVQAVVGTDVCLSARGIMETSGVSGTATWTVIGSNVGTVDSHGLFYATAVGTCKVRATMCDQYRDITVTVIANSGTVRFADYFPLHVGDQWTYSVWQSGTQCLAETETITGRATVDGMSTYVRSDRYGERHDYVDDSGWYAPDGAEGESDPGFVHAKPGLRILGKLNIGRIYQRVFATYVGDSTGDSGYEGYRLEAVDETVTVPAGEFKHCIRIGKPNTGSSGDWYNAWYAPGVGLVKETWVQDGIDRELACGNVGGQAYGNPPVSITGAKARTHRPSAGDPSRKSLVHR